MKNDKGLWESLLVVCAAELIFGAPAHAAVTLDGTLGPPAALTGPNYAIPDSVGQTQGNNLFHSFGQFSLTSAETATFSGASNIQNIIARVTGGELSSIDGRISSQIQGANFYLINPSGVVFGPNASLDVSGSFHVSSADYLRLADGGIFHASNPGASNLTVTPPAAFGFLTSSPAAIRVQQGSNTLEVPAGQTLSLIGGNIDIVGPGKFGTATLAARGGRLNLVSVASPGEMAQLSGDLDTGSFATLGDIGFSNAAFVTVAGDPGGTLAIRAGTFTMDFSSTSSATNAALDHPGVGTDIVARGAVVIKESEIASTSFGAGRAGHIRISADSLEMMGGPPRPGFSKGTFANIGSRARGTGRGGDVDITARSITLHDQASVNNNSLGSGQAGDIRIQATDFRIEGQNTGSAYVSNGAFASGNAGNISIAAQNVSLAGNNGNGVGIFTQAQSSTGNPSAGTLRIDATALEIRNGSQVSAAVFAGSGNGGRVEVNADTVHIAGIGANGAQAGLFAATLGGATGNGGTVAVNADSMVVADGGQVSTFSSSSGDAGNIALAVRDLTVSNGGAVTTTSLGSAGADAGNVDITADTILLDGPSPTEDFTGVFAVAGVNAGDAGDIRISTRRLDIRNGAQVSNRTTGAGAGGVIDISADQIMVAGADAANARASGIDSITDIDKDFPAQSTGRGGDVRLHARALTLQDGGGVSASSAGQGNAGNILVDVDSALLVAGGNISVRSSGSGDAGDITVNARELQLMNDGAVSAEAAQADGGNITINATSLVYLLNSAITASVQGGAGNGGNIAIDPDFVALNHSRITADAFGGNGGNVTVVSRQFLMSPDSRVTASSALGIQGNVVIAAPSNDLANSLDALPETALDAAARFKTHCDVAGSRFSRFSISTSARAPVAPGAIPSSYWAIGTPAVAADGSVALGPIPAMQHAALGGDAGCAR